VLRPGGQPFDRLLDEAVIEAAERHEAERIAATAAATGQATVAALREMLVEVGFLFRR
jgi:hypothetical protein